MYKSEYISICVCVYMYMPFYICPLIDVGLLYELVDF